MAFVAGVVIKLYIGHFYEFEDGQEVTEKIPGGENLQVGDTLIWDTGVYDGIAEIVALPKLGSEYFTIKKVS